MTREELTARLRKLTGKTADDIEALDERVDALEAGGSGGGVEFNTLDVTVTFHGENHIYTGWITSEIPENAVINDIIKIELLESGVAGTYLYPLPMIAAHEDPNHNFQLTGYETFTRVQPVPSGGAIPFGILFTNINTESELTEITENYRITYV